MKINKMLKKNSGLKIKELRAELSRAYLLIAVVAIVAVILLRLGVFIQNNVAATITLIISLGILSVLALINAFNWINLKK